MSQPNDTVALGVYVGPDTVDAVLVRRRGDAYEPLQRFSRPRSREAEPKSAEQMASALPGLSASEDGDYTLEVGGQWGSGAPAAAVPTLGDGAAPPAAGGRPFAPALTEVLAECAAAGYTDPPVSFCLTSPDVHYVEVVGAATEAAAAGPKAKAGGKPPKGRVAERVRERAPNADPARTAVVPLAGAGPDRLLAVAVERDDPVTSTLTALAGQPAGAPASSRLDAEATLLAGLVGLAHASDDERTVVVRVGAEDTLVVFLEGRRLSGVERIRSLSAYDLPDTVASRVLLQLDARKLGEPDTVYVASTGRPDALLSSIAGFFPDAAVEPLHDAAHGLGVDVPRDEGSYRAGALLAALAAARDLSDWEVVPDLRLLPAKLQRRRRSVGANLFTLVAGVLVLAVLAVGVTRYLGARAEIDRLEDDLRANPPVLPTEDPDRLQARVDSLDRAFATYTRALDVLDSLLVGSDRWTRTMRTVTRSTISTGDTWLLDWAPDGGQIRLTGESLSRPQVVELTRRLDGTIESLQYTDIGPRRVYQFVMVTPVDIGVPEVAMFLREVAEDRRQMTASDSTDLVLDPTDRVRYRLD